MLAAGLPLAVWLALMINHLVNVYIANDGDPSGLIRPGLDRVLLGVTPFAIAFALTLQSAIVSAAICFLYFELRRVDASVAGVSKEAGITSWLGQLAAWLGLTVVTLGVSFALVMMTALSFFLLKVSGP